MLRYLLVILGLSIGLSVTAQQISSCDVSLEQARDNLSKGRLYIIPSILSPCIDKGFNKAQKIEAYYILTRTYLLIDDPVKADSSYLELLKLDPEYDVDEETDPIDIVYINKKFITTPVFMFFGKAGINYSYAQVIQNLGTDNTDRTNENYSGGVGFNIGVGADLNFGDKLSIGMELNYHNKGYSYNNTFFNRDEQNFTERQSLFGSTLYLKYRTQFNNTHPFAYFGFSYQYLISAKANVELIDQVVLDGGQTEFSVSGPSEDLLAQRQPFNRFLVGGIGAKFRYGYNYLLVDLRYTFGLNNFVESGTQYANNNLLYKYGYVDDFKRMNTVALSVGWIFPRYKPRRRQTGGGFIRKVFKKK